MRLMTQRGVKREGETACLTGTPSVLSSVFALFRLGNFGNKPYM